MSYDLERLQSLTEVPTIATDRTKHFEERISYDDVLLVPQFSDLKSRNEANIHSDLDSRRMLEIPIIASPMDTVSESEMAAAMSDNGGLAVIHRYNTIEQQAKLVHNAVTLTSGNGLVAAAIGASGDFYERAQELVASYAQVLCIDVAHGHHILMKEAIEKLKKRFGNEIHLMAGNVATLEGFNDLADWGADSIRCNIGGGSICSTRIQTGHGVPGLTTIFDCARSTRNAKIIADGGLKNSGDIVKALAAGADFVMLGSLLSGTTETPGELLTYADGSKRKSYRGMASRKAQEAWRGRSGTPEGIATTVHYKGPVENVLTDLCGGIRSGLSYSGSRTIKELQAKAQFIKQTSSGQQESSTHILKR